MPTGWLSADTGIKIGTSAELWMNLQAHYDLEVARDELEDRVKHEVTPYKSSGAQLGNLPSP